MYDARSYTPARAHSFGAQVTSERCALVYDWADAILRASAFLVEAIALRSCSETRVVRVGQQKISVVIVALRAA